MSKEHVLAAAEVGAFEGELRSVLVLAALLVTVVLTAAYCMRAWVVLDDLAAAEPERHDDDRATPSVTAAVGVLAALTVVGGLLAFTPLLDLAGHIGWWMALVTVLLVLGAAFAVRSAARGSDPAIRLVGARIPMFDDGFGADAVYLGPSPNRCWHWRGSWCSSTATSSTPTSGALPPPRCCPGGAASASTEPSGRRHPGLDRRRGRGRRCRGGGAVVIALSVVLPMAVALWLVGAGRGLPHRTVNHISLAASAVTLAAVIVAVLVRPTIDRAWVPTLGMRWRWPWTASARPSCS